WNRVFFSFSLWTGITVLLVGIQYLVMPESLVVNFQLKPFLLLMLIAIALIPIQTSLEEYFFRGYLLQALGILTKNRWFPLLFTSVLFGLAHMSNPEVNKLGPFLMIYYIGTGLFLGILTLMDDGLELSIGFHAANNLITALLVTADWQVFQTYSIFKDVSEPNLWLSILPSLIVFPLLLLFFAKKYGWTDWKGKLFGPVKAPVLEKNAS
ncbi:MAG: lysostaphin resistance A-like protein, partial [Flavicella sp.]